ALLDKALGLVAERIGLDEELELDALGAELDHPVEDELPVLVAGKIVVGDEQAPDAARPVLAEERLDVVGRAPARFPALPVDDRAERTLVRAAAAGIEG